MVWVLGFQDHSHIYLEKRQNNNQKFSVTLGNLVHKVFEADNVDNPDKMSTLLIPYTTQATMKHRQKTMYSNQCSLWKTDITLIN